MEELHLCHGTQTGALKRYITFQGDMRCSRTDLPLLFFFVLLINAASMAVVLIVTLLTFNFVDWKNSRIECILLIGHGIIQKIVNNPTNNTSIPIKGVANCSFSYFRMLGKEKQKFLSYP